ncbi:MAG: DNA polymerase I [Zetaproteobacteria bacterium CG_4_9_14_3_um_filter_49_83]|nr:MAG: DNA polymerase I [Zetaproteobacteria bacterium CG1_02_49_23]PIQ30166.1 MAG: DNA polymerase I [Zetaproteobacteria bacterium CG17_big_fil_post_rev_8_21_14_2_50_50_13]PIV31249.1 MAG: DNA polymerase I [Zetaproteobacteria bacterium CG02_land_8_20_14_3_00_50_9]PIY54526.1 MAG: DNA polymerase I [Zetaproteobacteria bacterium CG_4_10_14_0_8_um_filter_49_80]PJA35166.1 MAG: DNA polymerase I [Zetaproteobacteria bacterium CG_4_9_14_3_um_filter_49_83]
MPHLVLIDGPNYVFRAFHAVKHNLANSKGQPTNAVFGYVQMIRSILKDLMPTHIAVVFDPKGGTFRNRIYPEYKAHRPPMPEDLAKQWPYIFDVTDAFNLNRICVEDYEADDVIATLARQAEKSGWDVTIVSTDKDLMQLIGERIWMLDTMRRKEYGSEEVLEKWGVYPDRIHDLLALTGDSSDNIPGVPGIGPKTAVELLQTYGDLESVLANASNIKQKMRRENLIQFADQARLSYKLVALEEHTPLPVSLEGLTIGEPNREKLCELFELLEFRRLTAEFLDTPSTAANGQLTTSQTDIHESTDSTEQPPIPPRQDILVDNAESLKLLVKALTESSAFAVDTETTSLHPHQAKLVGLSFAVKAGEGWYIPVSHRARDLLSETPRQLSLDEVLNALKPALEDPGIGKYGQNIKYDLQILRSVGIHLKGIEADSMLLAYIDEPGQPVNMDALAEKYLNHHCITYESVAGKGAKQITFDLVPVDQALPYAAEDAEITFRLVQHLQMKLANQIRRHNNIELPLACVLADMEWAGTQIHVSWLQGLSSVFGKKIESLEKHIHQLAGEAFNINSPKQLGVLLFETLGLEGGKRTKSGQWATAQDILEKLADEHEIPRLILQVRSLSKLKSTYTDSLPRLINSHTGRVHTSYNQAVTTTGRLSSSDPNLQNIPIRSEEGREIRKAFIAAPEHTLIAADYSQIELRLMAHFSQDKDLIQAFANGADIHAATAAAVNQVPLEQVTGSMRRHAKIINFGILYGMSAFGLSKQLGISRSEAKVFIETYFARYPAVRQFMDKTLDLAREQGYVETLLGHRVYVHDINSSNGMSKAYAERTAINAPLQGSAADIIKVAMINLHQKLQSSGSGARMLLQVHDELIVECPNQYVDEIITCIKETMESVISLRVPLIADVDCGINWFEAHKL